MATRVNVNQVETDSTHRFVTDTQIAAWNAGAVVTYILFYLANGTQSDIPCVGGVILFYLTNGTQSNITLV